jgi:hypothetical protein
MCLSKVTVTPAPSDLIVDGWKEFGLKGTKLAFQNVSGTVETDKWMQASESGAPTGLRADDGQKYKAGFHAYFDEREAKRFSVTFRRVYLRNITCIGDQDGRKCVVAQEMYVPSDPDAWPPLEQSRPSTAKKLINRIKGGS